ncbi:cilia- and flagella-associated protein 77 [Seriola lalandi dorsalis]|uniref:cilia- and flagella-associated protein 77 n=1 Tax=Seriola lalandi dorsalis TaxID=1841481 RepID=UPI000C6F4EB0|nr:cilia- and flagella-associated protein 77 [Seriola lalandi dorsalis]XP_023258538.1 cilia- and flagella-associated protein 77 [Seriola lalandi dorsalis]XP_056232655.1 cilia- and flagella-associated protein 77 [Seriola aureovittata]
MSSPRVGVVRDSMMTNPLLIKASLGQTRSRGLSVPGPDFTFGTNSSSLRDGGVAEVLSSWRVQSRRGDSAPQRPLVPDFVSLNREAVKSGLVTSKELSQYRAQGGGARTRPPAPKQQEGGASWRPAVPDITFGVTTRASSPLSDLLSHQYARRWLDQQLSRNQTSNHRELHRIKPGCIPDTRTSLLRRSRALPVTQTPFRLPRFSQVPPALDTFRDQDARLRALRAHQSDSVCRRGHQGQGTYSLD